MSTPFKMKGSPMARNFGIGSPVKQTKDYDGTKNYQKEANDYYLKSGKIHNEGDKTADDLHANMVWQYGASDRKDAKKKKDDAFEKKATATINKIPKTVAASDNTSHKTNDAGEKKIETKRTDYLKSLDN